MFNLFKSNPTKKMRKELAQLQEKSMQAQRKGDIRTSSELASEADALWQKIQDMENNA